eukprot:437215-Amphidinium_carterae.3
MKGKAKGQREGKGKKGDNGKGTTTTISTIHGAVVKTKVERRDQFNRSTTITTTTTTMRRTHPLGTMPTIRSGSQRQITLNTCQDKKLINNKASTVTEKEYRFITIQAGLPDEKTAFAAAQELGAWTMGLLWTEVMNRIARVEAYTRKDDPTFKAKTKENPRGSLSCHSHSS